MTSPVPYDTLFAGSDVTDFEAAARIDRHCRQAGVAPRGVVDCMIVAVAYRRGAALLAWDVDMDRAARVIGVELDKASLRLTPTNFRVQDEEGSPCGDPHRRLSDGIYCQRRWSRWRRET